MVSVMAVRTLSEPEVAVVSLDEIGVDPTHNPRTDFNAEELKALEARLEATDGLVQSLAVQKAAEDEPFVYTLVDGERRYRALRAIGVEKAPVLILKTRNAKLAATAANQSRVPLNPIEEAHGINALAELEGLKTNSRSPTASGRCAKRCPRSTSPSIGGSSNCPRACSPTSLRVSSRLRPSGI